MSEDLENLILARHIEGKGGRGKQKVTYLMVLCKSIRDHGLGGICVKTNLTKCQKG